MKIQRNMSTEESCKFWLAVANNAKGVDKWPSWRRAGVNTEQTGILESKE